MSRYLSGLTGTFANLAPLLLGCLSCLCVWPEIQRMTHFTTILFVMVARCTNSCSDILLFVFVHVATLTFLFVFVQRGKTTMKRFETSKCSGGDLVDTI
jgi:hypothetical protein